MKLHKNWILVFICALFFFQGCFFPPKTKTIRIGITPFPGYSFFHLAAEKGYLNNLGFRFELVSLSSLADVQKAFERGQVDVFAGTAIELLNTRALTAKMAQAFYVIDYSKGADMLLAQEDISDIRGLVGKRVAFEPQTVDVMMVYHALNSAGLKLSDIQQVPMSQLEIPDAFLAKKIDAAQVYAPASDHIMRAGKYRKIFDSSRAPFAVIDVLMAEESFIRSHAEALAQFIRAFEAARRDAAGDGPQDMKIISDYMGIEALTFAELVNGLEIPLLAGQKDLLKQNGEICLNLELSRRIFAQQGLLPADNRAIEWATSAVVERALRHDAKI